MNPIYIILGMTFLLANSTYWSIIFMQTYFAPEQRIIHSIGNEGNFELGLMFAQYIFILGAWYFVIKQQVKRIMKVET